MNISVNFVLCGVVSRYCCQACNAISWGLWVFDLALLETGTDAAALVDDGVAVDEGVVGSRALRLGAMMRS